MGIITFAISKQDTRQNEAINTYVSSWPSRSNPPIVSHKPEWRPKSVSRKESTLLCSLDFPLPHSLAPLTLASHCSSDTQGLYPGRCSCLRRPLPRFPGAHSLSSVRSWWQSLLFTKNHLSVGPSPDHSFSNSSLAPQISHAFPGLRFVLGHHHFRAPCIFPHSSSSASRPWEWKCCEEVLASVPLLLSSSI